MSKKGVSYGSVSQVSDTDADISLNAGGNVVLLKKTAHSLIGTHRLRKPKPTARTRFDGWLRRDYSVKGGLSPGLMTSSQIRNLTGTSRGDKISKCEESIAWKYHFLCNVSLGNLKR